MVSGTQLWFLGTTFGLTLTVVGILVYVLVQAGQYTKLERVLMDSTPYADNSVAVGLFWAARGMAVLLALQVAGVGSMLLYGMAKSKKN